MPPYDDSTYGERIAPLYDAWYPDHDPAAVALLARLAAGGPALELGIGTGRVALPLRQAGVEVHGIDASSAMVDRLRAKPGGDGIPVTLGSFADIPVSGPYALIYVLFNTFFQLLTQADQLRCFASVAPRLRPGGVFLVEAFVPDLSRFTANQALRAIRLSETDVRLEASVHDPVAQQVTTQHVVLTEQGIKLYPVKIRYAWPSELDLMARLAGLRLAHRWDGWDQAPFSTLSGKHISVYEPMHRVSAK
jgi:SAM-dependent methyltransferase